MFDKLRSVLGRKSYTLGAIMGLGAARAMGRSFDSQCSDGYEANGWVMRCIRMRVEAVSSVPLVLYSDRTKKKEIESDPILDILYSPNDQDSWPSLAEDLVGYRLLTGNSFLYAPPTSFGPRELYALNTGGVSPGIVNGLVNKWYYSEVTGQRQFAPEDVMHWMCWNPRCSYWGLSPLTSAALSVMQNNEAKKWNSAILQNGGKTWGTFSTDRDMTDTQYNRLKADIDKKYTGPDNAGKPIVLEGGLHWEQMGLTSEDMSWLEGMKASMREICAIYATPSQLLGDAESSTYANYKEANKAFWRGTVVPDLTTLRDELNHFLVPKVDRTRKKWLDFDTDGIDALQEDKDLLWTRLDNATWLTVNEKRIAAKYEPTVNGDVFLWPMTSIPQDVNEPIEPASTQGTGGGA